MRLIWRPEARADLRAIAEYIAQYDDDAADRMVDRLERCAERLVDYPLMYRFGRIDGTREALAHPNYLLVYRVGSDFVEIYAILHTRQQYP